MTKVVTARAPSALKNQEAGEDVASLAASNKSTTNAMAAGDDSSHLDEYDREKVVKIQSMWRGHKQREAYNERRGERIRQREAKFAAADLFEAAFVIQRLVRRMRAQRAAKAEVERLKKLKEEESVKMSGDEGEENDGEKKNGKHNESNRIANAAAISAAIKKIPKVVITTRKTVTRVVLGSKGPVSQIGSAAAAPNINNINSHHQEDSAHPQVLSSSSSTLGGGAGETNGGRNLTPTQSITTTTTTTRTVRRADSKASPAAAAARKAAMSSAGGDEGGLGVGGVSPAQASSTLQTPQRSLLSSASPSSPSSSLCPSPSSGPAVGSALAYLRSSPSHQKTASGGGTRENHDQGGGVDNENNLLSRISERLLRLSAPPQDDEMLVLFQSLNDLRVEIEGKGKKEETAHTSSTHSEHHAAELVSEPICRALFVYYGAEVTLLKGETIVTGVRALLEKIVRPTAGKAVLAPDGGIVVNFDQFCRFILKIASTHR